MFTFDYVLTVSAGILEFCRGDGTFLVRIIFINCFIVARGDHFVPLPRRERDVDGPRLGVDDGVDDGDIQYVIVVGAVTLVIYGALYLVQRLRTTRTAAAS